MYPEMMVAPMRQELTQAGIAEARTAADVEKAIRSPSLLDKTGKPRKRHVSTSPGIRRRLRRSPFCATASSST